MTASGHPPLASSMASAPNSTQALTMQHASQPPQQQSTQHLPRSHRIPSPLGRAQPLTPNGHSLMPQADPTPVPAASPPTKRDLKSWWKNFKLQTRNHEPQAQPTRGIFGVPLHQSIIYANVAISLIDDKGKSYIYGYVPIVVAKCGIYLKETATEVEGIFRLSGSEKRIKELKHAFDSPDRYGKGLVWTGYTVHDAANVLRRYLNDLPEPVVPLAFYGFFRQPLRYAVKPSTGDGDVPQFVENFDMGHAIERYQQLIKQLPPLHRQLLLYILDLLAVFAAKSDINRMNSQNLAAIFQPGILSHPSHAMAPEEYRLNQTVLIFLIENQDHFLIGMNGTAADEQTVQNLERGTPPVTPGLQVSEAPPIMGVSRTVSNASAGAESVAREGQIRRNRSTSSRNSRRSRRSCQSNTNSVVISPRSSSPALATTPSSLSNGTGSLSRSNTLPARSPGLGGSRFAKRPDVAAGSPISPMTPIHAHPSAQATPTFESVEEVVTPGEDAAAPDPFLSASNPKFRRITPVPDLGLSPATPLSPSSSSPLGQLPQTSEPGLVTPPKEKRFHLFQRTNTGDNPGELKPAPNKLRKKRIPSSANPSAQSSTASLQPPSALTSPRDEPATNPFEAQFKREEQTTAPALAAALLSVPAASAASAASAAPAPSAASVPSAPAAAPAAPTAPAAPAVSAKPAVSPSPPSVPEPAKATEPATVAALPSSAASGTATLGSPLQQPRQSASPATVAEEQDLTPRVSQVPSAATVTTATTATTAAPTPSAVAAAEKSNVPETSLKPRKNSPPTSLHSSFNEGSDIDQTDDVHSAQGDAVVGSPDRAKKRRWRLSKRSEDAQLSTSSLGVAPNSPGQQAALLGSNDHAAASSSSVGSGGPSVAGMGSLSLAGVSGSDSALAQAESQASTDSNGRDEHSRAKLAGWLKSKIKVTKDPARTKSPSPTEPSSSMSAAFHGRGVDANGGAAEGQERPSGQ